MDNLSDSLSHENGVFALEDVAAHIDTAGTVLHNIIGESKSFIFGEFLSTGNDYRNRAGGDDFIEMLAVVSLDDLNAHFCNYSGRKLKISVGTLHVFSYSYNAKRRNTVFKAGVDDFGKVIDALELTIGTDEGLYGHAVCIEPDGIFNIYCNDFMTEVVIEH